MKISDALTGVNRLHIETAPIIYYIEQNPNYLDRMRSIIDLVVNGQIEGVSSVMTLTEVLVLPLRMQQHQLEQAYRQILLNSAHFEIRTVSPSIAIRAAELRAQYTLRTPDAIQVATALDARCDALLTNDKDIKPVTEIRVLLLDDLEVDAS